MGVAVDQAMATTTTADSPLQRVQRQQHAAISAAASAVPPSSDNFDGRTTLATLDPEKLVEAAQVYPPQNWCL